MGAALKEYRTFAAGDSGVAEIIPAALRRRDDARDCSRRIVRHTGRKNSCAPFSFASKYLVP